MMKTTTLLALSLAGLAATAGLACFVIVSASEAPSAVIAEEKERTVSRETAPEATPRLLPSPQSGKSRAARKADAPSLAEPKATPSDKAAKEPLASHSKGLPEAPEEGAKKTKGTQETQGARETSENASSLSSPSSFKSEFPRAPLTTEKMPAPSVLSVVKNKSGFENKGTSGNSELQTSNGGLQAAKVQSSESEVQSAKFSESSPKTLPQEPTVQMAPTPAAPLPSKRRPWPKGNFTPEQERYRAQYGWQTFSEAIVAEAKEEIAR